jgi:hypothetical protein
MNDSFGTCPELDPIYIHPAVITEKELHEGINPRKIMDTIDK